MVARLCEEVEGWLLKTAFRQCYTECVRWFGHERIRVGAGVLPANGGESTQICASDDWRGFSPRSRRDFRTVASLFRGQPAVEGNLAQRGPMEKDGAKINRPFISL